MFFSIIVPIFNIEKYLDECLNSIRMQTFGDFEVLMVDDGSTDGCRKICEEYSQNDNRFIYIYKKNEGVVSARKRGAECAKGVYIISVDGDDCVEKCFLERIYHVCKNDYDMIAFGYTEMDENGVKIEKKRNKMKMGEYVDGDVNVIKDSFMYDEKQNAINGGALIFSVWSKAVKRDIYKTYQQRVDDRISKGDDVAVLAGVIYHCKSIYVADFCDYNYRIQSNSITRVLSKTDFVKQSILRDYLLFNIGEKYNNQVKVFLLYTTIGLLIGNIRNVDTYSEYKNIVEIIEKYDLFKEAVECTIKKPSLKCMTLMWLIKNRCWKAIYFYYKILIFNKRYDFG